LFAGLINTLILSRYIDLKISVLLVHSLVLAVLFFGLNLLLNFLIIFGNFSALSIFQRVLNYSFLALLTVGIWLGLGTLFDFLFWGNDVATIFSELIIIYIPIGLMLYFIVLQIIVIQQHRFNIEKEDFAENEILQPENLENEQKIEILEHVAVRSNSKIHVIPAKDIYFLSSDGDYVQIYTENSKHLKEQTMKYFETHLPRNFLRVHRSYIVNCEKISRVELLEKQTYYLILKNNQRIKMSVAGYRFLREKLVL
jgi:hypothetical protein